MILAMGEQILVRKKRAENMADVEHRAEITDLWAEALRKTGELWITIVGDSMSPLIQTGDSALVRRADVSDIAIGDIVTFKRGRALITHRVVGIVRDTDRIMIVEKGDRSSRATMVDSSYVVGKATAIKRGKDTWPLEEAQKLSEPPIDAGHFVLLRSFGAAYSWLLNLKQRLLGSKNLGLRRYVLSVWARAARFGISR
jgi:hypothetical protein